MVWQLVGVGVVEISEVFVDTGVFVAVLGEVWVGVLVWLAVEVAVVVAVKVEAGRVSVGVCVGVFGGEAGGLFVQPWARNNGTTTHEAQSHEKTFLK